MCRQCAKKCGQVLLEAVIVFICLALIAVAATRLFANLNLNMLDRLTVYRDSRIAAVNNLSISIPGSLSNPTPITLLDYSPHTDLISSLPGSRPGGWAPEIPGGLFNESFFEEPRLSDATLALEKTSLILDLILPYKINQADSLAHSVYLVQSYSYGEDPYGAAHWEPQGYIEKIKSLVSESIQLANAAYSSYCEAIDLYKDILNNPKIPGSFDSHPEEHPELYGLNPEDADYPRAIENLSNQNNSNRRNLQDTINALESAKPSLENWLNIIANGMGTGFLGLKYVRDNIGSYYCYPVDTGGGPYGGGPYGPPTIVCEPTAEHFSAVETLQQAVDFTGDIASPFLNSGLAGNVNQLYFLFQGGVESYEQAESARDLATSILNDNQVQADSNLKNIAQSLNENLNSSIEHWDDEVIRKDYLDFSFIESWGLYEVANLSTS